MIQKLHPEKSPPATTTAPPPLEVHDMTVAYHRKPVLWDVDLVIPEGKLIAVVGPNGAGKSTLIKAILGIVPRASGRVEIYGQPYEKQRAIVGYVPQRESVDWDFPVNALDVVMMGRYGRIGWFRRPGKADREAALACLEKVGMAEYARRQINQLSGGQQQRVFLARALAQEARLYFMDEPFVGVDAATERAIVTLLRELKAQGKTVVAVHHALQTVKEYFDHVILLNMRAVANGPVDEVFTNENLQKTYGGKLSLLDQVAEAVRRGGR
ncbi:MAG TPA: ABC transporter ATP-binding protein [Planctomycetota bacterium]|nr:ABC transporter ATP-binding protein [Planctomycetota bacterium]